MTVDTARMRKNLDSTHGLILAEAVMIAAAKAIGRAKAHDVRRARLRPRRSRSAVISATC